MSLPAEPTQTPPLQYQLPGRVSFGWIPEAWRLFTANAGPWIVGVLAMFALPVSAFIVFYVFMMASAFSGGLGTAPGALPRTPPGATPFPMTSGGGFAPFTLHTLFASGLGRILLYEYAAGLVMTVYVTFFYGSLFRMAVRQVRGLPIEVKDVFRGWPLFGRMLGATLLLAFGAFGLEVVLGLPVLLVNHFHPLTGGAMVGTAVVWSVVYLVFSLVCYGLLLPVFSLMADGDSVWTALRRSIRGTKEQWLPATGFVFVLGLLVYVSYLVCGVGLLATVPMVFLICALAYRDLVGMPNMVSPSQPTYGPPEAGVWPPPPVQGGGPQRWGAVGGEGLEAPHGELAEAPDDGQGT